MPHLVRVTTTGAALSLHRGFASGTGLQSAYAGTTTCASGSVLNDLQQGRVELEVTPRDDLQVGLAEVAGQCL